MKKTFYAFLVMAAPVLAQCPNPQLAANTACVWAFPMREFGHPTLIKPSPNSAAPNLVTGQELYHPTAVAFDGSVTPPRVYVVDTGNNRVLGWSNADKLTAGNTADLVLGQPASPSGGFDFTSTVPWGPGSNDSIGLNSPTGVAVDASGNVYVSDSGNNRILRFATPYKQQPGNLIVDLVIGQKGVASGNQPNQGFGGQNPTGATLYLAVGSGYGNNRTQNPFPQDPFPQTVIPAGLTIDSSGNLWAADPGNNRVLMYPAANLTANTQLPPATSALGQTSLTSSQIPSGVNQASGNFLQGPSSVAVDKNGTVYVADQGGRVLVYPGPAQLGETANPILGLPAPQQGVPPYPSQYSLGSINSGGGLNDTPQGVFVLNGSSGVSVFVCDSPQNRVVVYDSLAIANSAKSPAISTVIGQNGPSLGQPNGGSPALVPSDQSFSYPVAGAIRPDNNEMWIVDQSNHRVLAFANQGGAVYNIASRVLGQLDFTHNGANLLDGSGLWIANTGNIGGGIAVDRSSCTAPGAGTVSCSSPPHLYVADTLNNRILGFKDVRAVGVDARTLLTQQADIVIGQVDFKSNLINSPNNTTQTPTATGLASPEGLAVDNAGNLWVADAGNARVVRFPTPFSQPAGAVTADVVLGQSSLNTFNPSVSQFSMTSPYGLAIFPDDGRLAVSDLRANRVLIFASNGGTFTNGQAAQFVIGQPTFTSANSGNGGSQLNQPLNIGIDSSDRLYVCDFGNNRLLVYSKPGGNTPPASVDVPVGQPVGLTVSLVTGQSWITNNNTVFQLPEYSTLQTNQVASQNLAGLNLADTPFSPLVAPLALTLDPFDNLIVADSTNRITFYYDQLFYRNSASYSTGLGSLAGAGPTPTMLAELHLLGTGFNFTPSYSQTPANLAPPWPLKLNGVQVTVNGVPAPIFRMDASNVGNGGVLVEIPNGAPSSGPADFVISNPDTGQIYAVATYNMQQASPALFTSNAGGTGQIAAISYDSKGTPLGVNSPSVPVAPGGIIGLWLTGAGNVPNLPADGIAPGPGFSPSSVPTVLISAQSAQVVAQGMSPDFPGVWQVNVIVPKNTLPTSVQPVSVVVQMNDFLSNIGGTGTDTIPGGDQALTPSPGNGLITTIFVK